MSNNSSDKSGLNRYLSPIGAWALAFGCSVGWGSFVMPGTTFLPIAGPVGTALGMLIGGFIMLLIGANYHYMMNNYSDAGGTYSYSKHVFGYDQGYISAWFLLLAYVAIVWANATAIPLICRYLFSGLLEIGPCYKVAGFSVYIIESLIAAVMIILAGVICLMGGKVSSFIQTTFAFILIGGILLTAGYIFMHGGFEASKIMPYYAPEMPKAEQVFSLVVLAPWAFVGYESISHSAEEFKFSAKKSFLILAMAILTGVVAYSLLTLIAVTKIPEGCEDWISYVTGLSAYSGVEGLPTFNAVISYMGAKGFVVLGFAAAAAIMTGLVGNTIAASRLIYSMSRDRIFPGWLHETNDKRAPHRAILVIMLISIPIPFFGRTAISWIVDVNTIGAAIAYAYTSVSALVRARKEGDAPYVITGFLGSLISVLFAIYFLIPNLLTVEALPSASYLILIFWSLSGFGFFYYVLKRDHSKRLGKSTNAWITLIFMIFFVTMLWFRESSHDASEKVLNDLNAYNIAQLNEHGITLDRVETIGNNVYLDEKIKESSNAMQRNSVLLMAIVIFSLFVMFKIYAILQKRERDMESQKISAEENSRAKTAFLSSMSHDIRAPLNAIIGYTGLAMDTEKIPDEAKGYLDKIDYSSKFLLSLINDILDMGRIENGKIELMIETADLEKIFDDVYTIFDNQMQMKRLKFTVDKSIEDRYVLCDANRLSRILQNLISNALKFTPENGSVSVTVKQYGKESGEGIYEIKVKDTGMGMSPEFAKTIFEEYSREDSATRIQGTGLGMAITKRFVELMAGDINVETKKGAGTEFTISLSFKLVDKEAYDKEHRKDRSAADTDFKGINILLVEDQPVNREIETKILKKFGFSVDHAENGKIAVDKVNESPAGKYQVILMDIQMPVMNGYEAAKAIRALEDVEKKKVPIIAMTGNAFSEDIKKTQDAGMNAHITKPVDVKKMIETIDSFVRR